MTAHAWRIITLAIGLPSIGCGVVFIASIISEANPRAGQPWAWALTVGALATYLAGERWRAALRRQWAILDRVNDELARVRARRLR